MMNFVLIDNTLNVFGLNIKVVQIKISSGHYVMFELPHSVLVNKDENNRSTMKDFTKIYINNKKYRLYSINHSYDTTELGYVSE